MTPRIRDILGWLRKPKRLEDREKVLAVLNELNAGLPRPVWDESTGFLMMPSIKLNATNKRYDIMMDSGLSVKLFVNTETGEAKVYWADRFIKSESDGSR